MLNSLHQIFVHFKCIIENDLDFYVRVSTCEKRVAGKQPLFYDQSMAFIYCNYIITTWVAYSIRGVLPVLAL